MSENTENTAPVEGTTTTETAAPAEPTFSAADVERILAHDRDQRAATTAEPDDPIAKFRATTAGSKLYAAKPTAKPQPAPQQPASRLEAAVEALVALQIGAMKPPAPPPPPKPMSHVEKLASADPAVWLRRGSHNEWGAADREALIAEHRRGLIASGYQGDVQAEAELRMRRDVVAAGQKALANIRLVPDNTTARLDGETMLDLARQRGGGR